MQTYYERLLVVRNSVRQAISLVTKQMRISPDSIYLPMMAALMVDARDILKEMDAKILVFRNNGGGC